MQNTPTPFNADLYAELVDLRLTIAQQNNVHAFIVVQNNVLLELATYFPQSYDELSQISGFGRVKMEKYGKLFLDAVLYFCTQKGIESRIHLKNGKRISLPHNERIEFDNYSKRKTLSLYKEGKTPEEIALIRSMSRRTVDVHLAFYISAKEISIHDMITAEKAAVVLKAITESDGHIGTIKRMLGKNYSYSEIRYVQATIKKAPVFIGALIAS